jgi:hypothetical protein
VSPTSRHDFLLPAQVSLQALTQFDSFTGLVLEQPDPSLEF